MVATIDIDIYPLGNADTTKINLADGRKVLIDYADMRDPHDSSDLRCDLPNVLMQDLHKHKRSHFDAVCITHLDEDHCKGFGNFFALEHRGKNENHGVAIHDLWVPAAAILETGLEDDALVVQSEARYRLKRGCGVKVFSRPLRLEHWVRANANDVNQSMALVIDAGQLIPGFDLGDAGRAEFFVHSPFSAEQDEEENIDRNKHSVVLHATFRQGADRSRMFFGADVGHSVLCKIVQIAKQTDNEERLQWDAMKLPHHCSYLSLGSEAGRKMTIPAPDVQYLIEACGSEHGCIMVSTSEPIPKHDTPKDREDQPPYCQAANYYRDVARKKDGSFLVTMEYPNPRKPSPLSLAVTEGGIGLAISKLVPSASSEAGSAIPRAG